MLHYWYSEAEGDDADAKPIVLWLNGGPGSSSVLGMLQEMGPVLINATGGLMHNEYAWTKQANLLILESPAGVGYSYCAAMLTGGNCSNTDVTTAKAARAALQDFFRSKFPELRPKPFYITGESYAGVYIPTLTKEVLDNAPEINIKGIAVGDPCTDRKSQQKSQDMLWYAHKHGFVPDDDFDFLWNNCSKRHPSLLSSGFWRREEGRWAAPAPVELFAGDDDLKARCNIANRRYLITTSKGISQGWAGAYINELDLFSDSAALDWTVPGTLNYYNAKWMNSDVVKAALHVDKAPIKAAWPGPAPGWQYKSVYDACNYAPDKPSMIQFYQNISPRLKTTIVFNGDVDPCVSYEGTRVAVEKVGFDVLPGGAYRPWFYNKKATTVKILQEKPGLYGPNLELRDAGAQFGGQVVNYAHGLSFATVHGSGHMVPQFRPQAAERLLDRLLTGDLFAPLLPTDAELGAMTDAEFDQKVDDWTDAGRASVNKTFEVVVV